MVFSGKSNNMETKHLAGNEVDYSPLTEVRVRVALRQPGALEASHESGCRHLNNQPATAIHPFTDEQQPCEHGGTCRMANNRINHTGTKLHYQCSVN